jgi:hypothetical protein
METAPTPIVMMGVLSFTTLNLSGKSRTSRLAFGNLSARSIDANSLASKDYLRNLSESASASHPHRENVPVRHVTCSAKQRVDRLKQAVDLWLTRG